MKINTFSYSTLVSVLLDFIAGLFEKPVSLKARSFVKLISTKLLALCLLTTAGTVNYAVAQDGKAGPQVSSCENAGGNWSESEKFVLSKLCAGEEADLLEYSGDLEQCRPPRSVWEKRTLSAQFVEFIFTSEVFRDNLPSSNVAIKCAHVEGLVDLTYRDVFPSAYIEGFVFDRGVIFFHSNVRRRIMFHDSYFNGSLWFGNIATSSSLVFSHSILKNGIDISHAKITGNLNFQNVDFGGDLDAGQMRVEGSIYLRSESDFRSVTIQGSRVRGNVELVDSSVRGEFDASSLVVDGSMYLRYGAEVSGITRLVGARIGGNLEFEGSQFHKTVQASPVQVGNTILARGNAEFQDIALRGSSVAGNIEFDRSSVNGLLDLRGVDVSGSIYLRDGATINKIRGEGASVRSSFELAGGTFLGRIDLSDALFGGIFSLVDEHNGPPKWAEESTLILRNARSRLLKSTEASWMNVAGGHIEKDLGGAVFEYLSTTAIRGESSLDEVDVEWLSQWFLAQPEQNKAVSPYPYQMLSGIYEKMGYQELAQVVRYIRYEHEMQSPSTSTTRQVALFFAKYLVGFGVYPIRLGFWFLGVLIAGVVVARFSAGLKSRSWLERFWYSLENLIPFVELDKEHAEIQHGSTSVNSFFHLQKILGFLMATILVTALTVLG